MVKQGRKRAIGPRLRRLTWRQSHQKSKQQYRQKSHFPTSWSLLWQSLKFIGSNWQLLGTLTVIYGVLNFLVSSSFYDIHQHFKNLTPSLHGRHFGQSFHAFGSLFASPGSSHSPAGIVLEVVVFILVSLMLVWSFRQLMAKKPISLLDSFYSSTGQLMPFVLVLLALSIETIPLASASAIMYSITSSAIEVWGLIIFGIISVILALFSFYLLIPGILAAYIVLLPGMRPLAALRSANELVKFRRWAILWRLAVLPVFVFIVMGIVTIPLILFAHVVVAPIFYALAILAVLFSHTYLYNLYRSAI